MISFIVYILYIESEFSLELKGFVFLIYISLMDKQLLDALGNLSDALEIMAGVLQNKKGEKSNTTTTLVSGDFSKQLIAINDGITSLKEDTQEILKNQETILKMSSKKMVIRLNYSKKPVVRKRKVVLKRCRNYTTYSSWCISNRIST
jgi:hypothetical protein